MLRPDTLALTALLALLTALGPLAMDLYLPSLPDIGRLLSAEDAQVQLTISGYLVGFAGGQIVYGPVSDRLGRKPVLTAALMLFCAAGVICAAAPSITALIAARTLQGIGSSGIIVLARAVVRDLYDGPRAGRELSLMGMIMGLVPIVAPLIGGVTQIAYGWRAGFIFIFASGFAAIVMVWRLLPETAPKIGIAPLSFADLVDAFRRVGADAGFRAHTALVSTSYAGLFAYISGSSFVMQEQYGLDPFGFGIVFAVSSTGYVAGTFLASQVVIRAGLDRTIGLGALALAGGGVMMIAAVALAPHSAAAVAVPMALYLAGLGLAMPQALAGALQPFPDHAGAASSLVGFVQQSTGAIIGAAVGLTLGAGIWPFVLAIAAMGCLTLLLWTTTRAVRRAA